MSSPEDKAKEIDAALKARKDAEANAGEKLDKLLTTMGNIHEGIGSLRKEIDACNKRIDAFEFKRKHFDEDDDAGDEERRKDAKRRNDEEGKEPDEPANEDHRDEEEEVPFGKAKRLAADGKRRDGKYCDSRQAEDQLADAQSRADAAYCAWNKRAAAPLAGETPLMYRRRMLRGLQQHSADYRDIDLRDIPAGRQFDLAEARIYNDAIAASMRPDVGQGNGLREVIRNVGGREIHEFYGPSVYNNDEGLALLARINPRSGRFEK